MDLSQLSLKRFVVTNFKSIKRIELDHLNRLILLMGRNNAGKSNLLDAFKFVSDAAISFEHALSFRGKELSEVIHRKKVGDKIDFAFEFVLAPEKRAELINRLFAENRLTSAASAVSSNFLTHLTLKITVSQDQFTEELTAANLRGGPACSIFSVKGTPHHTEILYGQLESLCKGCSGELPVEPRALETPAGSATPFRLWLARPPSGAAYPVSYELAQGIYEQFTTLEWADPLRKLPVSSPIVGGHTLAADASNLPDVLHWLYNNKPKQFRKIESEVGKLVPQLGKLYTPTIQNAATLGLVDTRDEDLVFSMEQMSFGTRSIVAVVAKVILAKPGSWVCIEEPETYLHPKAQMGLFQFLRDESRAKRICVATHSTPIAASCPIQSLFIIQRDASNCTTATPVTPTEANDVIEQLGVKPSFSFEADAIVFVEDLDEVPVYDAWAKKFGFRVKVQFLEIEEASTLHYFANTRIALSQFVNTLIFAVFGNGGDHTDAIREKVVQQLQLPADQVIALDLPELEGYLLDAKAILRAFPAITLPEDELKSLIEPFATRADQKKALAGLMTEWKLGEYDGRLGARIADAQEAIPPGVKQMFEKIDARSKPYWKI